MGFNVTSSQEQNMSALTTPAQIDNFRGAIKLYLNTGMKANRAYTVSAMGRAASEYTGFKYKASRTGLLQAYLDMGGSPAQIK